MSEAINKFAQRLRALRTDPSLDDSTRTSRNIELAWEAVASLGDEAVDLMHGLVREDRWVFGALAMAIERTHAGSGRDVPQKAEPAHVPLFLVPVVFMHAPGARIAREPGFALPPLPDGRPVPGLVDFLLTWEELTQGFSATQALRDTLAQVRDGLAVADARVELAKVFGTAPSRSAMDEYDADQGRRFSLRFLPAYCLPTDAPWFATFDERTQWQQRAFDAMQLSPAAELFPYPQAPAPYAIALAIAESFVIEGAMRQVIEEAVRVASAAGARGQLPMELLFEPFGAPETGVASHFRISVIPPGNVARPYASVSVLIPLAREWAFWEDTVARCTQTAKERLSIDSTVAGLVQDLDLLFPALGEIRLHVTLGPPIALASPAPDGLPYAFPNAGDEHRKWVDYEREKAGNYLEGFGKALAARMELEAPPRGGRISFALLHGVWRPVMTLYLDRCRTISGKRLRGPLDRAALEGARALWVTVASRAWVAVAEAGGSSV